MLIKQFITDNICSIISEHINFIFCNITNKIKYSYLLVFRKINDSDNSELHV